MTIALFVPWLLAAPVGPAADGVARAALKQRLAELSVAPALSGAKVGLYVWRLDDQVELFAAGADDLLIPASNVKILTTAAALDYLGPEKRLRTEVFGEADERGVIRGDLVLKGWGDPWLIPERLWYLANRLRVQQVKAVRGNLVVDGSYFAPPFIANGWEQDRTSLAYMAPAGALSLGFNAVLVHVIPAPTAGTDATILIDPPSDYAAVEGAVATVARGRTQIEVDVEPLRDRSLIRVSGKINAKAGSRAFWRRIDNSAIYAGEVFKQLLKQVGITVTGRVQEGLVPEGAKQLAVIASPSLAEIVYRVNKHSSNFMATQLAFVLGAERFGAPGTWEKGRQAIELFLEEKAGIARGSYVLGNASGLHDVNQMTARQLVRVLEVIYRDPRLQPEFLASLAVAGSSGTLSERMRESEADHLLRAKTGTLSSASALSGYVTCRSGEVLAFAVLVNGHTVPVQEVWAVQDELGATLAAWDFSGRTTPVETVSRSLAAEASPR